MKDTSDGAAPPTERQEPMGGAEEANSGRRRSSGQFKPGRSGNARGRPQGARNHKTIVQEIAAEAHWVMEGGARRHLTTFELIVITIRNLAAEGDAKAIRALERCRDRYGPKEPEHRGGYLMVPERCISIDEIAQEAAELNEWQRIRFDDWERGGND